MDAASQAFPGWSQTAPAERARLFLKAAEIVKRRRTEIAEVLARETGSTISFATFQQDLVAATLEQVAGWVYLPKGEVLESNVPGMHSIGVRRALGVVACFTPWNGANVLSWRAVISPIAAGNTVVVKPSEFAPISAGLMLAEVAEEAGFPAGVVNVVPHAPRSRRRHCRRVLRSPRGASHQPDRRRQDGTHAGGARRAHLEAHRAGARRLQPDDHPRRRRRRLRGPHARPSARFFHQGQICMNTRRIIVQREDRRRLPRAGSWLGPDSLPGGDPLDPKTIIGPLITRDAVKLIDDRVKEAVARGATVHTGGDVRRPGLPPDDPDERPPGRRHRQRGDLRTGRRGRSGRHAG